MTTLFLKMKKTYLIMLAFFCCICTKGETEMPIVAYWGVPDWRITDEDFRTFKDCGFTVSLYPYTSLEHLTTACRVADRNGLKIIGQCPEMFKKPAETAKALKKERGFFGYMIQDEPSLPEIRHRHNDMLKIRQVDSTHVLYMNLLPYQRAEAEWVHSVTKASSYTEYLQAASATPSQQISFDHYPITTKGIRASWFHNLEMVRQESIRTGKPFWGFALSVPHADYPQPTMGSLRLQIYSNLAYGAQVIQYFTYWTPRNNKEYDFHDAPISEDGKKTKTYALVQRMNRELKTVSKLFYGAQVTSVHHLGTIPDGTTRQTEMPVNLKLLKIVGRQGAVISQLTKNGLRYLAIINKSHEKLLTVRIRPRNSIPRHLTKTLKEEPMKSSYVVEAGDILLFKLE